MSPGQAERTVVLVMRALVVAFAFSGILFLTVPDTLVDALGGGPDSDQKLWVALAFAYMAVITAIAAIVSTDPARYRPLILVLVAGKLASSLPALAFFVFHDNVFLYLLTFLVDGSLVAVCLACWVLAGRVQRPAVAA